MNSKITYAAVFALCLFVFAAVAFVETADGHLSNEITPPPPSWTPTATFTPRPTPMTTDTPTPTATPTPRLSFLPAVMRDCCATPRATP